MSTMTACPESLERIFQQVEDASERRAQDEIFQTVKQVAPDDVSENGSTETTLRIKARHRSSVSISRLGQVSDQFQIIDTPPMSPISRRASVVPTYTTTYQNPSADSLASDNLSDDEAHTEDAHHVTQMHQIAGRRGTISRAMGGLLPKRLGRSRSGSVVTPTTDSNMVIGVSVQEATTEHAADDEAYTEGPLTVVHTLRSQRSTSSLSRKDSLMDRARDLTKRFRITSKSGTTPPSS